jgi:predicted PurR-regulated permease PerM
MPSPPSFRRPPAQVPAAEIPGVNGLLTLAIFVVVVAGLFMARSVLIPITLAVLLSFLLAPLVNLLERLYLGRVLSVILAVMLSLGVILSVGGLIGTQLAGLASNAPQYEATIERKIAIVRGFTLGRLSAVMQRLGRQLQHESAGQTPAAAGGPAAAPTEPGPKKPVPVPVQVEQAAPSPLNIAARVLSPVVAPLSTTLIVLVFAIFMLLQREDLRDRMIRLFGSRDLHRTTMAMNDAAHRLSRYFLAQFGVNTAFGVITGGGLLLIGVPSAPLWGILGLLLRFVPYIGSWLAAAIPLALAAAVEPGWSMVIQTGVLYLVTEFFISQVVEPMLYGHSTGLSPFSVVVAATFWTWLWGPIGLILSTPLTLCLVVLGRHVNRLEFLDVLLGDRPALTPVESFYQRMLAGDPDEAHDQAELLLKERSLSSYYDEVAIKGLQLAANDAERGVLTDQQLERVSKAARALIEDLDSEDDRDPSPAATEVDVAVPSRAEQALSRQPAPAEQAPPVLERAPHWQHEQPILCLPGRGPIDDVATAMLAQLLSKHGLGARVASPEAAARENLGRLDLQGVAMLCLVYLDLSGTGSHLRYLIRRLRQRLPGAPILVAVWPPLEEGQLEDRRRATTGADYYAPSLREAVEACLAEARRGVTDAPAIPASAAA